MRSISYQQRVDILWNATGQTTKGKITKTYTGPAGVDPVTPLTYKPGGNSTACFDWRLKRRLDVPWKEPHRVRRSQRDGNAP
eukprot:4737876-Pyramimonas_sp.AAC.1